ncbi:Alpha/Beta hydrolase protein [Mycena rebaudengoi]|nr:Alpha/Beta hydrolase protein [Mycena rebaudengoi]
MSAPIQSLQTITTALETNLRRISRQTLRSPLKVARICSIRSFSALAALLQADFPLILPTLRGWGGSTGPDDPAAYKVTDNADDIAALVAHLQADKALIDADLLQHGLILVGHSMGAKIAQVLAVRGDLRPLLKGLVLIGPAPLGKLELSTEMRAGQSAAYSSRESAELVLKQVVLGSDVGADELRSLVDDMTGGSEHAKLAWPTYGTAEDYEALLSEKIGMEDVEIPTAVVVGGLDKIETFERVDEKVVQLWKKAGASVTVTVLENAGHLIPVEVPRGLDTVLKKFPVEIPVSSAK